MNEPQCQVESRASNHQGSTINIDWRILVLLVLAAACLTRLPGTTVSLWGDELKTMHDASGGPLDAVKFQATQGGHPPFYYLLVSLWKDVSTTDIWIRSLSFLIGLMTIAVVGRIGLELSCARVGWIAAFLATITHPLCWTSTEARNYALHILTGSLAWLFIVRAQKQQGWLNWLGFSISLALCWYSFYYGFYIAVGIGVYFLCSRPSWRKIAQFSAASVTAIILFSPWISVIQKQMSRLDKWAERDIPPDASILGLMRLDMRTIALHGPWNVFGTDISPTTGAPPTSVIFAVVLVFAVGVPLWKSRTKEGLSCAFKRSYLPVVAGAIAYILATNHVAFAGGYAWLRYMTYAGVPLCIVAALLIDEVPRRYSFIALRIFIVVGIVLATDRAYRRVTPPWREAVHWLANVPEVNQPIITDGIGRLAIQHYGDAQLIQRVAAKDLLQSDDPIPNSFLTLSRQAWGKETDMLLAELEALLKNGQNRTILAQQNFNGIEARSYTDSQP